MDLTAVTLLTLLVAIALAAPRYGIDSRLPPPGEPLPPMRRPSTPLRDLRLLAHGARAVLRR
ncbi:MAG: hypothetical protein ACRDXB_08105 [Actinomycetes bacterium]